MKARTMIYLEPHELKALKARAQSDGVSLAGLVRRLVRDHLDRDRPAPPVRPSAYARLVALGSSGLTDIAERHDAYLPDAIARDE